MFILLRCLPQQSTPPSSQLIRVPSRCSHIAIPEPKHTNDTADRAMPPITTIATVFNSYIRKYLFLDMNDIQDKVAPQQQQQHKQELQSELDVEFVFRDTVDDILKHLNSHELCQVSQVCKFFNEAVDREFSKRGFQLVLFPDTFDKRLDRAKDNDFEVSKMLSLRPDLSIMFCGPRPHLRSVLDLEFTFLHEYKYRLPNRIMIIGVDVSVLNGEEIRSSPTDFGNMPANGIQALLLSEYRQLKIKIASCESWEQEATRLSIRMVKQLLPENPDEESTLLCFGRTQFSTCEKAVKLIANSFKPNSYKLWGFTTVNALKIMDVNKNDFPNYQGMESFIGIRINGPNLKSYTFVFSLCEKKYKSEHALAEFASQVKLRKNAICLLCGPRHSQFDLMLRDRELTDYRNYSDIVATVKTAFPKIQTSGIFLSPEDKMFGMDSTKDATNQEIIHVNSVSLIILTFD